MWCQSTVDMKVCTLLAINCKYGSRHLKAYKFFKIQPMWGFRTASCWYNMRHKPRNKTFKCATVRQIVIYWPLCVSRAAKPVSSYTDTGWMAYGRNPERWKNERQKSYYASARAAMHSVWCLPEPNTAATAHYCEQTEHYGDTREHVHTVLIYPRLAMT